MGDSPSRRAELVERITDATLGSLLLYTIYIGDELGLYEVLAEGDALTSVTLAERTGTDERYVREWLEQQAVTGVLDVDDEHAAATERRFRLPSALEPVLLEQESVHYMAQQAHLVVGGAQPLDDVVAAFRTGGGVPYDAYGPLREGQARTNRAEMRYRLGTEWVPSIPDVDDTLKSGDSPAVADIGCGAGWACIGIAEGYPDVAVDGFDIDGPSVERARENVTAAGLDDRVTIHERDAGSLAAEQSYDLVTAIEVLHDLSDPVGVLRTMRRLVRPGGSALVVDQRVGETFSTDVSLAEEMMYGWSVVHCLPVGRDADHSAATGTIMRERTVREYADEAGFEDVEVLPIEHDGFRFYRLTP
ncbi:methyltransferase domain-containing protein [Haloferax sp. MBLA0076]|uniref:Methyltransferase domain-containing protein n=1 Tax=Haloferax litoreum TaxID=2666140 RepID=A0A6A8GHW5_9EURY|nr:MULTISPECIES: class I SAM-dependent methyltransferase [Haloferax]KAB1193970.1 class I SAM-dependent methyltransferase [Haloferax sp. CBA1148]MRX22516.1 methyltransferase domain-containing protein [Haloferax litoreum]